MAKPDKVYTFTFAGFLLGFFAVSSFAADDTKTVEELIKEIQAKYDQMKYETEDFEYPHCSEVFKRKNDEGNEMRRAALAVHNIPVLLKSFDETDHHYPAEDIVSETALKLEKIDTTNGEEAYDVPVYFSGDTQVFRLKKGQAPTTEDTTISQLQKGDYVLTTTGYIIDEPRYQKECWAEVTNVFETTVAKGESIGVLHYWGKNDEKIKITVTTKPCFYCRTPPETDWLQLSCKDMKRNTEFYSTHDPDIDGSCWFGTFDDDKVADSEVPFYNIGVKWTGSYFIGPAGSEILVHN